MRRFAIFKSAFCSSLPVLMGYLPMGIAFGILLVTRVNGATPWTAMLMSSTTISGSMQFAAVPLLHESAAVPLLLVLLLTFVINLRYAVYALPLLEQLRSYPWYLRGYLSFALTDETYAILVRDKDRWKPHTAFYQFCVASLDHLYWITGSVIGAVTGKNLSFSTAGIDFAMTALFIVILVDMLKIRENRTPAMIGMGVTLAVMTVFILFFPAHLNKALFFALLMMIPLLISRKKERAA